MGEYSLSDGGDAPHEAGDIGRQGAIAEVPTYLDVLPESNREVLVVGDVIDCRELNHRQGNNPYGFLGTCGLVSCEGILRQFRIDVTEGDVVRHAILNGLCAVTDDPTLSGGTTEILQARILADAGVPAHVETEASLSHLSGWLGEGRGVIIEVNAGELWNDPNSYDYGQANHAVVVTGAAADPHSGEVVGFFINDSGRGYPADSGRFVSAELMQRTWANAGANAVITDVTRFG